MLYALLCTIILHYKVFINFINCIVVMLVANSKRKVRAKSQLSSNVTDKIEAAYFDL